MHGLKQATILAFNSLVTNLSQSRYSPILHTLGMWEHKTRKTKFHLCVDDFGVTYFSKEDGDHLINALKKNYTVTTHWYGSFFVWIKH